MSSNGAPEVPLEPGAPVQPQADAKPPNSSLARLQTHSSTVEIGELSPSSRGSPFFVIDSKFRNSRITQRIKAIDADGDGKISRAELENAIEELAHEEDSHKKYRRYFYIAGAFFVAVLLVNMCLVYAVTVLAKETEVKGNQLYSKENNKVIQVDTASFKVRDEAFRGRGSADDGLPLETVVATTVQDVSPYYTDDFLAAVQAIRLSWPGAGSASLRVLAFARPAGGNGTVSILTSVGYVTVRGSGNIEVDAEVESFLIKTGVFASSPSSTNPPAGGPARRRLLQGSTLGPVETFAQYQAHMTRACEVTAALGAVSQEDFDAKFAQCWERKLRAAERNRANFIDGLGGIVVPEE